MSLNLRSAAATKQPQKYLQCHFLSNDKTLKKEKAVTRNLVGMGFTVETYSNQSFESTFYQVKNDILPMDFVSLADEYGFKKDDFETPRTQHEHCSVFMLMIDTYGSRL